MARSKIYAHLLPTKLLFFNPSNARDFDWPQHPLLSLILAFPRLANEMRAQMYSTTTFEFYSLFQGLNDGCDVARCVLSKIGRNNVGYIRKIRCHVDQYSMLRNFKTTTELLECLGDGSPKRKVKDLTLFFHIDRRASCFELHGLIGVAITFLPNAPPSSLAIEEMNRLICQYRKTTSRVNFLAILPLEVRQKIYAYVAPRFHDFNNSHLNRIKYNHDEIYRGTMMGALLVNHQLAGELLDCIYSTCRFTTEVYYSFRDTQEYSSFYLSQPLRTFLASIGSTNATLIRKFTVHLSIHQDDPELFFAKPMEIVFPVLEKRCSFRIIGGKLSPISTGIRYAALRKHPKPSRWFEVSAPVIGNQKLTIFVWMLGFEKLDLDSLLPHFDTAYDILQASFDARWMT
ncbi:hypothetical protein MMC12_004726 [Toensbergia leucococca]|nr:hypothetical protein [Toensbergia leucococca]